MAITDANVLTGQAAQIAQSMFAPATNILSSALNNAVDAGRRMVDLQSHQEDLFMTEREKLRLATERKGLEARRIFESDRTYDTDVMRDARNFAESARRDDRDFLLRDYATRQGLVFQGQGLDIQRGNLDINRIQAENQTRQLGISETRAETEALRYQTADRRAELLDRATQKKLDETSALGAYVELINPDILQGPAPEKRGAFRMFQDAVTPGDSETSIYNDQQKILQNFKKKFTYEDIEKNWDSMTPRQREIVQRIGIENLRRTSSGPAFNPNKIDSPNLWGAMSGKAGDRADPNKVTQPVGDVIVDFPDGVPTATATPSSQSPMVLPPRGSVTPYVPQAPKGAAGQPGRDWLDPRWSSGYSGMSGD